MGTAGGGAGEVGPTTIIITIGPNTSTPDAIRDALKRGATGFRFPASKFDAEVMAERAIWVAELAREAGVDPDLFLDLPGSKARLTNDDGFELAGADRIRINYRPTPARRDGAMPEIGLSGADGVAIEVDDVLVLGDGEDALLVLQAWDEHCVTTPLTCGVLGRHRGVTIRGKLQAHATLTERDLAALRLLPSTVFTTVILSFVQSAQTVEEARTVLRDAAGPGGRIPSILAKVETRAGVSATGEIAASADGVLLGRGDLLMDVGELDFFELQKQVIKATKRAGRPIVVGTHLLTSLSNHWLPNRSELAYLCHLLEKGVDGLLLSQETTVGQQPGRTIEMIDGLRGRYGVAPTGPLFPLKA